MASNTGNEACPRMRGVEDYPINTGKDTWGNQNKVEKKNPHSNSDELEIDTEVYKYAHIELLQSFDYISWELFRIYKIFIMLLNIHSTKIVLQ